VKVSWDRIIRTVVGLRPFRPSGFLVRSERIRNKPVIHNYGHGGAGVTLSWGTSHLAVEEAIQTRETRFAVLGAGAVGLASARLLQRKGFEVTIYARDLPPDTTSNVAGALWSPYLAVDDDRRTPEFEAQFDRAARLSHRYFQDLVGDDYGVRWIESYELSDEPFDGDKGKDPLADLYPGSRRLRQNEHPFPARDAWYSFSMLVEPPVYLNALMRDFRLAGGRVVVRELRTVEEVTALPEPAVVNCTGLGARLLFDDREMTPIKGQLTILLPQPEVDYVTLKGDLYMFPRKDGILLGGTHERGNWSLEPNQEAMRKIVEGHMDVFRKMKV
jgi:glycine/D-amino acid oxidase-like deaminating enzyme